MTNVRAMILCGEQQTNGIRGVRTMDGELNEPNPPDFRLGQDIDDVSIRAFQASCDANLNYFRRFQYAWSGDEKWKDLILLLREYNDNLYHLGVAGTPMLLAMTEPPENETDARRLMLAARAEINSPGTEARAYGQLLGVLRAKFVHEPTIDECQRVPTVRRLHIRNGYYRPQDNLGNETATMAFVSQRGGGQNHLATLVEWTNRTEDEARKISFLLKKLSSELTLLPTSLGVAVDPRYGRGRAGLMLALPGGFGTFHDSPGRGAISVQRRPQNLEEIIGDGPRSLSVRLRIAQKLATAVHTMHVIQYVHKLSNPLRTRHEMKPV
ncbi:hypothetical protein SPI_01478 [Niveomyces insectorum RCEF 264]|uniref:Uncharacterized protein n=1 Tax=Niveomyces insectorum RCEF 264 TaxID=1081102 RepID=A0A162JCF4_9HYPO|nr:hypothetical protein SPI_01478 [Niveomyces insectorum RCEF 264]